MKDVVKYARLLDLYGEDLTPRQYEVIDSYYCMDLTLEEIAQNFGISKQAVHCTMKNAQSKLQKLEEQFHIGQKLEQIQSRLEDIISQARATGSLDTALASLEVLANDLK